METVILPVKVVANNTIVNEFKILYTSNLLIAHDLYIHFNFNDYHQVKKDILNILNYNPVGAYFGDCSVSYLIKQTTTKDIHEYNTLSILILESVDVRFYTDESYEKWSSKYKTFKRKNFIDNF